MSKNPQQLPNSLEKTHKQAVALIVFSGVLYHVSTYSVSVSYRLLHISLVTVKLYCSQYITKIHHCNLNAQKAPV